MSCRSHLRVPMFNYTAHNTSSLNASSLYVMCLFRCYLGVQVLLLFLQHSLTGQFAYISQSGLLRLISHQRMCHITAVKTCCMCTCDSIRLNMSGKKIILQYSSLHQLHAEFKLMVTCFVCINYLILTTVIFMLPSLCSARQTFKNPRPSQCQHVAKSKLPDKLVVFLCSFLIPVSYHRRMSSQTSKITSVSVEFKSQQMKMIRKLFIFS